MTGWRLRLLACKSWCNTVVVGESLCHYLFLSWGNSLGCSSPLHKSTWGQTWTTLILYTGYRAASWWPSSTSVNLECRSVTVSILEFVLIGKWNVQTCVDLGALPWFSRMFFSISDRSIVCLTPTYKPALKETGLERWLVLVSSMEAGIIESL